MPHRRSCFRRLRCVNRSMRKRSACNAATFHSCRPLCSNAKRSVESGTFGRLPFDFQVLFVFTSQERGKVLMLKYKRKRERGGKERQHIIDCICCEGGHERMIETTFSPAQSCLPPCRNHEQRERERRGHASPVCRCFHVYIAEYEIEGGERERKKKCSQGVSIINVIDPFEEK